MMNDDDLHKVSRRQHPKPHFTFPDIAPVDDIQFERLVAANAEAFYRLFSNDDSPFVDSRFKDLGKIEAYVKDLAEYSAYSAKHGGQDWLFKTSGEYLGVIHLYNLSLETICDNHKRVWVGFATRQEARRKGITKKAVRHFIQTVFSFYPGIDFIHAETEMENLASINFLKSCGFITDDERYDSSDYRFFVYHQPQAT